ncbi:DUF935 domain-containing protein [Acinetobacter parvus]|uniref:DUF935 family protein n=1 Tax=Acinetobacter parvus NIPH 1103 TaxID=1217671 RepID=N8RAI5_9GAMM|nr:DUF935 family protein [Acinetobacter parvus]ENU32438.1 hypothetical protein F989_02418 [Acinetobacter parvus NIPH 1103]
MSAKGLYIGGEFVSFAEAKAKQPNIKQIASRSTVSGFGSLGSVLPNPDPILKKMGKDISVYKDIRSHAVVKGALRRRRAAVKAKAWRIVQDKASDQVFEHINSIFKKLQINKITGGMFDATWFGYQPCEITWAYQDGAWLPVKIEAMPTEWFFFDTDSQLRFKDKNAGQNGLLIEPRKYLVPAQDATFDNPYGEPDAALVFWADAFLQGGKEFWVRFTEKYGSPWVIGKYGNNYDEAKQEVLLNNLYAMVQDAVAVIPDNSQIEIIEAAGKSASADVFERFLMYCRSEINIALLGQNQTTEAEANRASATAGAEVSAEISDGDCEMTAEQFQLLIDWIVDYNWGGPSPQFEYFEDSNGGKEQADRDASLYASGTRFTNQYRMREYGFQEGDLAEPDQGVEQPVSFAEATYTPVRQNPIDQATTQLEQAAEPYLNDMVNRIRHVVKNERSFQGVQEAIVAEFSELPSDELTQIMSIAFALAELQGRSEVKDDD